MLCSLFSDNNTLPDLFSEVDVGHTLLAVGRKGIFKMHRSTNTHAAERLISFDYVILETHTGNRKTHSPHLCKYRCITTHNIQSEESRARGTATELDTHMTKSLLRTYACASENTISQWPQFTVQSHSHTGSYDFWIVRLVDRQCFLQSPAAV